MVKKDFILVHEDYTVCVSPQKGQIGFHHLGRVHRWIVAGNQFLVGLKKTPKVGTQLLPLKVANNN